MTSRSAGVAQTSREAQRQYKKHGPQLPERQLRQLDRAFELDQRAVKTRALEERKRIAKRKRQEKERKEREVRRQLGVGLATQMVGYSHTQKRLKSGMEAFLGVSRNQQKEEKMKEAEVKEKLEAIANAIENDPWDDEDEHSLPLGDLSTEAVGEDYLFDEGLDDDTLLEVHDVVMSDTHTHVPVTVSETLPPPVPIQQPSYPQPVAASKDKEFLHLHGPVNKAIDNALESLPEPLIELLSIDRSLNQPAWNPPHSLLHKLNPMGLPPHRLRIKIGCIVSLLRDLNTDGQLSKSSHLRVLQFKNERLNCLVLDGPRAGTKTILTRVAFCAKYRNNHSTPFQRFQYPVRVSPTFVPAEKPRQTTQSSFNPSIVTGHSTKPVVRVRKPFPPSSNSTSIVDSYLGFKLHGLPASKAIRSQSFATPTAPTTSLLDDLGDFLDSGTQIARELSSNSSIDDQSKASTRVDNLLQISTQDFEITKESINGLGHLPVEPINSIENAQSEIKRSPAEKPAVLSRAVTHNVTESAVKMPSKPPMTPRLELVKHNGATDKILAHSKNPSSKKPNVEPVRAIPLMKTAGLTTSLGSLNEHGLSTQDTISFFEDDELSSPTITV